MHVLLIQVDGKLPNLALMKLAHWHRSQGHTAHSLDGITIDWPHTVFGGTGTNNPQTVEAIIGSDYEFYDYQDYPHFSESIGFTKRGCRLTCKFCVVPQKEGKPYFVNSHRRKFSRLPISRHQRANDYH